MIRRHFKHEDLLPDRFDDRGTFAEHLGELKLPVAAENPLYDSCVKRIGPGLGLHLEGRWSTGMLSIGHPAIKAR